MIAQKTRRWIVLVLIFIVIVAGWGTLRSAADSLFPPFKRLNLLSESAVSGPGSEVNIVPTEVVIPFSSSADQIGLRTPEPILTPPQPATHPEFALKETGYLQILPLLATPMPEYTPERP